MKVVSDNKIKREPIKRIKKDYDEFHKCIFCGVKYRYNFEEELKGTKPRYMMSVWYKPNSVITKIKKKITKKKTTMFDNERKYICIACALKVNSSLMKHLKNFNYQRMKFEKEYC